MANIDNNPVSEELQAAVTLTEEPVIEVTDGAVAEEAEQQVLTPTPSPELTPTPSPTPVQTATETVTAVPTSTALIEQTKEETSMLPFIIGGVALILAVIAALAVVLLKKGKKPAPQPAKPVMQEAPETVAQPEGPAIYTGPSIAVGMAQTIGGRKNQQDSLYCSDWTNAEAMATRGLLAAVADGIGGLSDGNIASGAAMKAMRARFLSSNGMGSMSDRLLDLGAAAQQEVLAVNAQRTARSGSTLVTVLINDGNMVFLSIGDSRICLYRSGALLQLNREHVLGRINREKQAFGHAIDPSKKPEALTAYLGQDALQLIDRSLNPMRLVPGDRILLMSDGVFGTLSDAEIMQHLRLAPQQAAESIINAVNQKQKPHQDNATVLVIGIG